MTAMTKCFTKESESIEQLGKRDAPKKTRCSQQTRHFQVFVGGSIHLKAFFLDAIV